MAGLAFNRTLRSLDADDAGPARLGVTLAALGLVCGAVWLACARVSVYAVSDSARVETMRAFPVESRVRGDVVRVALELGRPVKAGEVLVELNSEMLQIALKEKRALRDNLEAQIHALDEQLQTEELRIRERQRLLAHRLAEAKAHADEATALSGFANRTMVRNRTLLERRLVSESDSDRADADADAHRAVAVASWRAHQRVAAEGRVEQTDVREEIARLRRELEALRGQAVAADADARSLLTQIDQCLIRAPAAGHLGEIAKLQIGAVLQVGDQVATVVPDGRLNLVAEYLPVDAVGRIQPGQPATLHLAGFPGIRYGTLRAVVEHVANETRDGHVRVDLRLVADAAASVRLRHGMPGTVDIEIDRASPAALVFRSVVGALR